MTTQLTPADRAAIDAQPALTHTPFGWMWEDKPEKFYAHRRVAVRARAQALAGGSEVRTRLIAVRLISARMH